MKHNIHPLLRTVFILGGFLSLMAAIQLFVLAERTDVYFAWTIQPPLTAAVIGAFFFGTMTFGFVAFREPVWENVRGAVVGLFLVLCLKLAATLLHLDRFHFDSQNPLTVFVTWVWLTIYSVLPLVVLAGLFLQKRLNVKSNVVPSSLPGWIRVLILLHGTSSLFVGFGMFTFPQSVIPLWGWTLTPLTARALSAWFLSFAVVDWFMVRDDDWRKLRIMALEYIVSVVFVSVALMLYSNEIRWGSAGAVGFVAYLALMLVIGVTGYRQGEKQVRR